MLLTLCSILLSLEPRARTRVDSMKEFAALRNFWRWNAGCNLAMRHGNFWERKTQW
jgi:hypothetical protein